MPSLKKEDQHSKISGALKKSSRAQFLEKISAHELFIIMNF